MNIDRVSYFENGIEKRKTYTWDENHNKAIWHTLGGTPLGDDYYIQKSCYPKSIQNHVVWVPEYLVYIGKYIIILCDLEHLDNIEKYWNMQIHNFDCKEMEEYLKNNILYYKGVYHYVGWQYCEK